MQHETKSKLYKLFADAKKLYADKSLPFNIIHKKIAEPFMEIMKADAK